MIVPEMGKVDLRDLEAGLAGLLRASKNLAPLWRAARRPLRADQMDHAKKRMGPNGAWPPRSPFTLERMGAGRRRRKGGKQGRSRRPRRKRLLGRLPGAIRIVADARRVVAESLVRWSIVHQEGGKAGRGVIIPQRTFLWPSDRLVSIVTGMAAAHILRGWK